MTLKHYAAILMALFMEQTYATNFNSEPYTLPPTHCAGDFLGVFVSVGWAGGAWGESDYLICIFLQLFYFYVCRVNKNMRLKNLNLFQVIEII